MSQFEQNAMATSDHAKADTNNGEQHSALAEARSLAFGQPNRSLDAKTGPASLYPDPNLTPGDTLPVTAEQVCTPGYSKSVRHVTEAEKKEVFAEYGTQFVPHAYEVDHFISLELGGSNDIRNLWPEPYDPRPGAHEKDRVENYLHEQVCKGNMSLPEAQREISTDWYAVYEQIQQAHWRGHGRQHTR